jgi:cytidylate kinase
MAAKPLAELFERQARRWEIEQGAGMPAPRGAVVSVSRQPWAGGDEIAERVAGWLDYGLFGLESLRELAGDPALRDRLVADLDPGARAAIEARARLLFDGLEKAALRGVASVVAALGERGMAVVVGRGAISLLPRERTLRVLVVAPAEERARRLGAALGAAPEPSRSQLQREDQERLVFLRDRLGLAGDDPSLYDLVVNTERLSLDAAAALVVEAVRRRFPPGAPAGG